MPRKKYAGSDVAADQHVPTQLQFCKISGLLRRKRSMYGGSGQSATKMSTGTRKSRIICLGAFMIVTGAFNTIILKYQDISVVGVGARGDCIHFFHPGVQALFIFFGEMLCMIPFWIVNRSTEQFEGGRYELQSIAEHEENVHQQRLTRLAQFLIFLVPAACDILSTVLLNIGLYYTFASSCQILRVTVVIFAGIFTCVILRRGLHFHHWIGLIMILSGAVVVAISTVIFSSQQPSHSDTTNDNNQISGDPHPRLFSVGSHEDYEEFDGAYSCRSNQAPNPLLGNLLIIAAQAASALQFIIEERFLKGFQVPPLCAVGLEGFWGLLLCILMIPVLSIIPLGPQTGAGLEDFYSAVAQIREHKQLQVALVATTISMALFNFFGLTLSKDLGGFSRAVIDTLRTVLVWSLAYILVWEKFYILQLVGFVIIIAGSAVFNEVIKGCLPDKPSLQRVSSEVRDGLLGGSKPLNTVRMVRSKSKQGFMTRSVRVGAGALSPHSLGSVGNMLNQFGSLSPKSIDSLLETGAGSSSYPNMSNLNAEEGSSPGNGNIFVLE